MEVTGKGDDLIKRYLGSVESLERAKRDVSSRECDMMNARNELAKWLMPDDAKPGEKIAVWYGDSLIQVEVPVNGPHECHDPKITIRKRGRALNRAA